MNNITKFTVGKIHFRQPNTTFIQKRLSEVVAPERYGYSPNINGINAKVLGQVTDELNEIGLNGTKKDASTYIKRREQRFPDVTPEGIRADLKQLSLMGSINSTTKKIFDKFNNFE